MKEQNRRVRRRWKEGALWPLGTEARLTLKHTSRWSSADRWSWTAELKWWPSRRRSSSGSYIPVKGAVGNSSIKCQHYTDLSAPLSEPCHACCTFSLLSSSCANTEHQKYHSPLQPPNTSQALAFQSCFPRFHVFVVSQLPVLQVKIKVKLSPGSHGERHKGYTS